MGSNRLNLILWAHPLFLNSWQILFAINQHVGLYLQSGVVSGQRPNSQTGTLKIGLTPQAADMQAALWSTNMCMTTHNDPSTI